MVANKKEKLQKFRAEKNKRGEGQASGPQAPLQS